ncbi:MAG: DUF1553 domain-containing protein [Planctomycetes bacterium]|nr:DUF1553 domain-containing protein [Planctomycetota bacterium]
MASRILVLVICCLPICGRCFAESKRFDAARMVLISRCLECHSGAEPSGGLNLSRLEDLLRGGESQAALVPGKPDESLLLHRVQAGEMPPPKGDRSQKLPELEIQALRDWIVDGAPWTEGFVLDLFEITTARRAGLDWWSLQPVNRRPPPDRVALADLRSPVDAFVEEKLAAEGWRAAPLTDPRTAMRRLYADTLGLPPPFEDLEEFAAETNPDSWERLIDRSLASWSFGERSARHWLDVARYAESCGYERDQLKPAIWKYRDWVIGAFNADLPYDAFVRHQLAGDEVEERSESTLIATGFLRLGTWNDEPNDPQEYKYDRLEDLVHASSTAFLGLTLKCARCHDHKFDPIRQEDYYRFGSAFWAGFLEPAAGDVLGGPDPKLLGGEIHGWTDRSKTPPDMQLLKKGDPKRPGPSIAPAHFSFVASQSRPFRGAAPQAATTQRRLQFAEWITEPANPLASRVWVNRVWQRHFGHGLVRSPDNFGFTGDRPTHPELLDWLASELVERNWSTKRLQRMLLASRTYRQASTHPLHAEYAERDFANRLWWRSERRRLDADALRDSLLAVSGELDLSRRGGPSFAPTISAEALEGLSMKANAWKASPKAEQMRRSVYMLSKRSLLSPLATTFDFPDTTLPCGQRDVTTVAPQALAMLNNEFIHDCSQALAESVLRGDAPTESRIAAAWRAVLGRPPSVEEFGIAATHLRRQEECLRIQAEAASADTSRPRIPDKGLVLWLRADAGVDKDELDRVRAWCDVRFRDSPEKPDSEPVAGRRPQADQPLSQFRPIWVADAGHRRPAVRFDGSGMFLHVDRPLLTSQQFTIVAVVRDAGGDSHREIVSNWDGQGGNSTTSVFLGLTGRNRVRLSDDFVAGELQHPNKWFCLTGVARTGETVLFQNDLQIARRPNSLSQRNLSTRYVIGQQGNINGEFWHGEIAELLVYDQALEDRELRRLTSYLGQQYQLPVQAAPNPQRLTWQSLCHVLLNTNEFIYVD